MYAKKYLLVLAALIFSTSVIFGQSLANSSTSVAVQLKKGLSITPPSSGIDFGEKVIGTSNETISVTTPVAFLVSGHSNKNIIVDYSSSVNLSYESNNLTFAPKVEKTSDATYVSGSSVGDESQHTLTAGTGLLYLWLGGSIDITPTTIGGDYTGTFNIEVSYN
ncbi:MAG: DUF4402 domain-containing protein [Ignavibacteriae bacterium]|nr:DUF4402 domain-containing protein [Ignavibacteriota bacterium]